MAVYLIGLGLGTRKQVTIDALETASKLDKLYLDTYTGFIEDSLIAELSTRFGEKLVRADRKMLEDKISDILQEAERNDVGILVPGDPLIATTHSSIIVEAINRGVEFKVIHGVSIYCAAISSSCLHSYKFGRATTIPKSGLGIETCYRVISENMERGLHTLVLLDTAAGGVTIPDAIELLLKAEEKMGLGLIQDDRLIVCLARIGFEDEFKWAGRIRDAVRKKYPPPPHTMIFPGELHFSEMEALRNILGVDATTLNNHNIPRSWRSRTKRYIENVGRVLDEIGYLSDDAVVKDLIEMAKSYLEDAEKFWEAGDLFNSSTAISYAEGILDALRLMGKVEFTWRPSEGIVNKG
ncbi:MAG: diphthine synthase [Nitrososphaerota archaeon]|nr:diphthine synthase [Nitrososphaerota archaeon]